MQLKKRYNDIIGKKMKKKKTGEKWWLIKKKIGKKVWLVKKKSAKNISNLAKI